MSNSLYAVRYKYANVDHVSTLLGFTKGTQQVGARLVFSNPCALFKDKRRVKKIIQDTIKLWEDGSTENQFEIVRMQLVER